MSHAPRFWVSCVMVPADQLLPIACAAEELGFEGVTYPDHAVMPDHITSPYPGGAIPWEADSDWPDPWVLIGAAAAVTTRLRFATNVYVLPARHPLIVARAVATAGWISSGRVVLGIGVGWMAEESAALDQDFHTRGRRTDEALVILRSALAGGPVEHTGTYYAFPSLHVRPTSPSPIPIWVGGESQPALRRAGLLADGWITEHPIDRAAAWIEQIRTIRSDAGLDAPFDLAVTSWRAPTDEDLVAFDTLGVDHVKVQPWLWGSEDPSSLEAKLRALELFASRYVM